MVSEMKTLSWDRNVHMSVSLMVSDDEWQVAAIFVVLYIFIAMVTMCMMSRWQRSAWPFGYMWG